MSRKRKAKKEERRENSLITTALFIAICYGYTGYMVVLFFELLRLKNAGDNCNAPGLAFFGFNFSFLRPASPPF